MFSGRDEVLRVVLRDSHAPRRTRYDDCPFAHCVNALDLRILCDSQVSLQQGILQLLRAQSIFSPQIYLHHLSALAQGIPRFAASPPDTRIVMVKLSA